jgi:hypothetical protein
MIFFQIKTPSILAEITTVATNVITWQWCRIIGTQTCSRPRRADNASSPGSAERNRHGARSPPIRSSGVRCARG